MNYEAVLSCSKNIWITMESGYWSLGLCHKRRNMASSAGLGPDDGTIVESFDL